MAYIVHLTLVLDQIFWQNIVMKPPRDLTKRLVKETFDVYKTGGTYSNVNSSIRDHVLGPTWQSVLHPERKIEEIIKERIRRLDQ